ncbi:uncharacterized protein [Aquarana catesbeiana]|uniref:uncharacterized protein n=1 Tax=Aquarana catesbeiana TaxID=8400 RepID=UPI003CCA44A1
MPDMAERILDLTLEIIYLLTGEDYIIVKKSGDDPTSKSLPKSKSLISFIQPSSLIHVRNSDKKILEVTNKIIDLLTGEVPIRCQDVTVYFSMEEWEYLEGHKDLYKDVMMDNQPPLTSPDGSSNGNPPERCLRPLDSGDSTQEGPSAPLHGQIDDLVVVKVEDMDADAEEETYVMEEQLFLEEESSPATVKDGQKIKSTSKGRVRFHPDCDHEENNTTQHSSGENTFALNTHPGFLTRPSKPSNPEGPFPDQSQTFAPTIYPRLQSTNRLLHSSNAKKLSKDTSNQGRHSTPHEAGKNDPCSECGKCFTENSSQHAEEKRYQCLECGKRFFFKSDLTVHQRVHTGEEPYPCFECGKRFSHRTTLVCHQRMHRGEKPFLCSDCGKCFTRKSCLLQHERIHTGVKPYVCSECGKSFNQKSSLISHQRGHRGEKPFTCSVCGKSFTRSSSLVVHHRFHTGERPYTCLKCGKCFSQKANFVKHQKIHTR